MQIPVPELIVLTKNQIPQKRLQILASRDNSFLAIEVVCTYQCIAEVPGVTGKKLIGEGVFGTAGI